MNQYVKFKNIDASFVCNETRKLWSVPDLDIFKDKTLGLVEKKQYIRFFKLVQQHLEASEEENGDEDRQNLRILEEDSETSFVEFLKKMWLPPKIKSYSLSLFDSEI